MLEHDGFISCYASCIHPKTQTALSKQDVALKAAVLTAPSRRSRHSQYACAVLKKLCNHTHTRTHTHTPHKHTYTHGVFSVCDVWCTHHSLWALAVLKKSCNHLDMRHTQIHTHECIQHFYARLQSWRNAATTHSCWQVRLLLMKKKLVGTCAPLLLLMSLVRASIVLCGPCYTSR